MRITTPYAVYEDCTLHTNEYVANKSLYIGIIGKCEGEEYPEPIADLTICLPNERTPKANEAYVDTNNCPWAMQFIEENGLGTETGLYGLSGYCMYPLVEFNMDKIREAC